VPLNLALQPLLVVQRHLTARGTRAQGYMLRV
jgi:hypothetical protein